jgi:hypothetical protein
MGAPNLAYIKKGNKPINALITKTMRLLAAKPGEN